MATRRSAAAASDNEVETPVRRTRLRAATSARSTTRNVSPPATPRRSTRLATTSASSPSPSRSTHASPIKSGSTPAHSPKLAALAAQHTSPTKSAIRQSSKASFCFPCSKERFVHSYIFLYNVLAFVLSTSALIFFWNTVFVEPLWKKSTAPGFSLLLETRTYTDWLQFLPRVWDTVGVFFYYVVLLGVFRVAHVAFGWEHGDIGSAITRSLMSNIYWGLLVLGGNKEIYSQPACALWVYIYALQSFIDHAYAICYMLWPSVPMLICWAHYNLFYVTYPLGCGAIMILMNEMTKTYQPSTPSIKMFFMISYFVCPVVFSYLYESLKHKRAAHLSMIGRKPARLF